MCRAGLKDYHLYRAMALVLILVSCNGNSVSDLKDEITVDYSMVEPTAAWLDMIKGGVDSTEAKSFFMKQVAKTPGCNSIIRHWKRFMDWDNDIFYGFITEAFDQGGSRQPERDTNGDLTFSGRKQVFWQTALNDPDKIRRDVKALQSANLFDTALALAKAYLPHEAVIRNNFFIVLFGGSSAYAVGDDNGFDLLQLPSKADGAIDIDDVTRTFAHEMHHTGIAYCQERGMSGADDEEELGLVGRLVNEGIPIYYINRVKERLDSYRESPDLTLRAVARDWDRHLARLPEIYSEAERDIRLNLEGEIGGREIMPIWMDGSQGQAYVLGSEMISIIDSELGLAAAMEVARDYRQLLVIYNRAATKANRNGADYYIFSENLARNLADFDS